ncbi:MAG: hypothetical protein ACOCSN_02100 [Halanaeroarchaeum sp.]
MKVDCPTCDYEFETTAGLQCPRCGNAISCSTVGCSECQACSNPLSKLGTRLVSRVSLSRDDESVTSDA